MNNETTPEMCPKCGSALSEITTTPSGKKLQRCSTGSWNSETRKTEGCDFVKWIEEAPEKLDEACPKCGSPLLLAKTRTGKKLKKCSTSGWDRENKKATGCEYVQWIGSSKEELEEECPLCKEKLVMMTTSSGKKMKKCSTSGWDPKKRQATGCTFIEWQNSNKNDSNGDENFPDHE
ncbi:MAG: hypothetical protein WCO06_00630 [Candidatus Roizmanbacteria bacterium]